MIRSIRNAAFILFLLPCFTACDPATVESIMKGTTTQPSLTNEEVIAGLKEALNRGTKEAVSFTSKENGFLQNQLIRIPFPADAAKVKSLALTLGMNTQVEKFEANLNHAAEKAAIEAIPVFENAIRQMTIQDGFNILKGDSTAATAYLKSTTSSELTQKFSPIVRNAINEVKLTSYWQPLATAYNNSLLLTGGQPVNPDLEAYVTQKALDGLFFYISVEEKKIRRDPAARVTEILRKVFGSVDHK